MQTLKELILDAQANPLFTGIPRDLKIEALPGKAAIVIGVRRCGKSTYINQIASQLLAKGVPAENLFYINFFDDRLSNLKNDGLTNVAEAYFSIYPEKKNKEKIYCFFDEIQVVPGWEKFVDRLLRTENCEVYITGSSSKLLSKEIATQMRGRSLSWELFPFSFEEFLTTYQINYESPFPTQKRLTIQKTFEAYFEKGGFPEVIEAGKNLRIKIHQEYFNSILFRDLIERYDIRHPRALMDLARWLIDNIASSYSLNSLTKYLKLFGHKVHKNIVSQYLDWLEDAYFLFTVKVFDASLRKSNANPKKIYCIDQSLVKSVSTGIFVNSGRLLENMVFIALRRIVPNIWYYKTKGNHEVDFIVQTMDNKKFLFQVSESLANHDTRQREINSLRNAMKELRLKSGMIITYSDFEQVETENGIIRIIPAWRFFLEDIKKYVS
ncbi:MAG: ATP-binding protein [Bacteroidetes bacterium]|nr:ATP-binding protein [Bacteroidota bacterium]